MSKADSGQKVILNTAVYSISGLLLKCFSFFLLPLYTAYLSTEDYAITSIAGSFLGTMSFVVALSLFSAVKRFYVDLKHDPDKLSRFYGTICTFVFCTGFGFAILGYIFRDVLAKYVFSGIDFFPVIAVCLISLVFQCQHTIFDTILRSQQKAYKSSLLSIIFFFIAVGCNITFVVWLKMGAVGTLLASLISYVLYTAYLLTEMLVHREIRLCLDIELLKEALKYSIPIIPHNLSTRIAELVSKLLIGGSASLSSLGVFSIATQFGNIADTIQGYVSQAYGPWLYEKLHDHEPDYQKTIYRISGLLCDIIGLFFLGIALFSYDYIVLLLDKSYADAWKYVPLVVMIFAIKTAYYFYVEILFYYKKASRVLFLATVSGSLLNLLLSAFAIPRWGAYGAIAADAVAMFLRVAIVVAVSKQFEDIGLRIYSFAGKTVKVGVFILLGFLPLLVQAMEMKWVIFFLYKVLVVVAYVLCMAIQNWKYIYSFLKNIGNFGKKGDNFCGRD